MSDHLQSIKPPDRRKKWVRAIIDACIQGIIPFVGGSISRLGEEAVPRASEKAREAWEDDVSTRVNETTDRVDVLTGERTYSVTGLAAELLAMMLRECPDGLRTKYYDPQKLVESFPDQSKEDLETAAHDLDRLGLASLEGHLGGWELRLGEFVYEQCDSQIMGWDTTEDARTLAAKMLEANTGDSLELINMLGWEKRRFNPAQRIVVDTVPDGLVRRNLQAEFVTQGILMSPQTTAALRHFLGV